MRLVSQSLMRYSRPLVPAEGLGFSWGGFHPFRINDWKKAAKKIDAKLFNITGLDKIKPLAKLHTSLVSRAESLDKSVSKDFQKGKKWAQAHRKELQIAAAVVAAAVGGAYALGYLGTSGAAAGATGATGIAAPGAVGTTAATTFTASPLTTLAAAPSLATATVAPGVVTTAGTLGGGALTTAAAATGGGGILSTIGTTLGTLSTAASLVAKVKAATAEPTQTIATPTDYQGTNYGGGFMGGGYGGGSLGPIFGQTEPAPVQPASPQLPPWILPAGLAVGLFLLLDR